jgi:hypothetical protein
VATYAGKLWLSSDQSTKVDGEVTVEADRISISSGGVAVGDWPRSEVEARAESGFFYFDVEGETLLFLPDSPGLEGALSGLPQTSSSLPFPSAPSSSPVGGTSGAAPVAAAVLPRYRSLRLYSRTAPSAPSKRTLGVIVEPLGRHSRG